MTLLVLVGVKNVFVRARFIHEAPAVRIHLEPRLRTHPEEPVVARLCGLDARLLIRPQRAPVEHHHGVRFVHLRARPEARADAVAVGAGHRAVPSNNAEVPGLERLHHPIVLRVAARCDDNALFRDVAHVLSVAVAGDAARDAARLLFELEHPGVEVEFRTLRHCIVKEDAVAVEALAGAVVRASPTGRMADCEVLVARLIHLVARLVPELDASLLQAIAVPVDRFARLFAEELHEVLAQMPGGVLGRHRHEVELVDLRAPGLLVPRIQGAEVVPDAGARREAVDADHLCARFRGRRHGEHAARAAADHQNVGFARFRDALFVDLRGFPKPVAVVLCVRLFNHLNRDLALRLRDALRRRLRNRLRRDGCARDGVDAGALRSDQHALQFLCRRLADGRRLVRNVEHDVRNAVLVEGHRDDDVADARSFCRVRARTVDAGGRCSEGRASGRDRGASDEAFAKEISARQICHFGSPLRILSDGTYCRAGSCSQVKAEIRAAGDVSRDSERSNKIRKGTGLERHAA